MPDYHNNQCVITDLDNTLYDWVEAFIPAFRAMVHVLTRITGVSEEDLYRSFKVVYAKHQSLEYPFAIQELEVLENQRLSEQELKEKIIHPARIAFSRTRDKRLQLYPNVKQTLHWLKAQGFIIIGLTDTNLYQAERRLQHLHIDRFFDHLISRKNFELSEQAREYIKRKLIDNTTKNSPHIQLELFRSEYPTNSPIDLNLDKSILNIKNTQLEPGALKPATDSFEIIATLYQLNPELTYLVGDNLWKDISLAQKVGVNDIWARYGKHQDSKNLDTLRLITYWSERDISCNKRAEQNIKPKYTIEDFSQIRSIVNPRQMTLFADSDL